MCPFCIVLFTARGVTVFALKKPRKKDTPSSKSQSILPAENPEKPQ